MNRMKDQYSKILKDGLKDEVDLEKEWARLSSTIKKDTPRENTPKRKFVSFSLLRYAAAILLGVLFASSIALWKKEAPAQVPAGKYTLCTDKGEKSRIELPDGTSVWLNTCTTLSYSSDYGIANRDIHLEGEAYFEVARNEHLPFVVKTNELNVTALGTTFNISAYADDAMLVTTLFSGQVAVLPTRTKQEVRLNPNQSAVYHKDLQRIETKSSGENKEQQWRDGILSFEMRYVEDIAKTLERNYDIAFRFENQKIKKLRFSGTFHSNESINDIVTVIATNTSINYRTEKDTIVFK